MISYPFWSQISILNNYAYGLVAKRKNQMRQMRQQNHDKNNDDQFNDLLSLFISTSSLNSSSSDNDQNEKNEEYFPKTPSIYSEYFNYLFLFIQSAIYQFLSSYFPYFFDQNSNHNKKMTRSQKKSYSKKQMGIYDGKK